MAFGIVSTGFFTPNQPPAALGATVNDWHKDTFWNEPWDVSGVHKGIDIFDRPDTPVVTPTHHCRLCYCEYITLALANGFPK